MTNTMKNIKKIFAAALCCLTFASCAIIPAGVEATSNPVGSKCGETESYVILGVFSKNGEQNNVQEAAKNGGITKISHVDQTVTNYVGGIVQKINIKVYGE